ncbi:MAG: hypothetical protein IKG03_03300 [Clostridiales bacterium]|nr:hypothetical protein [Clostridiales bacterium]
MQDIDPMVMKDMAKLKNVNEADALLHSMKNSGEDGKSEIKSEYQSLKEVEELKRLVEKQSYIIHAFWIMLKEKGATNDEFDKALTEAVLLGRRTDYRSNSACPNCGKSLQSIENKPFASKCLYCGIEILDNPYKKYDGMDPYKIEYRNEPEQPEPYISDDEAEEKEFREAADVISQSFEPYDVTKDLNFDDET